MTWLLLAVATMATVEAFFRLPIFSLVAKIRRLTRQTMRVLTSARVSDHWKERALPRYAVRLFVSSLQLSGWMALALGPFFCIAGIAQVAGQPVLSLAATGEGVIASCVIAVVHVALRPRPHATEDYGPGARLLHQMALGVPMVAEASFDVERMRYRRGAGDVTDGRHVFVAGLARAGTTILMRLFHQTGEFGSLTYRDMPFVLAPNLWARISAASKREMVATERAHKDGILVDFDSPEALEEVFWRILGNGKYLRAGSLHADQESDETIPLFRDYIALVLKRYGKHRYLSKNNNNILRLNTIRAAFPNATVLIPFRDPLQHCGSLLKQHRLFCDTHRSNPFSRKYMTWLAHHEFGGDHRPFVFDGQAVAAGNPDTLDYWLDLWISVYEALLVRLSDQDAGFIPLGYELLCDESEMVWKGLKRETGLDPDLPMGLTLARSTEAASGQSENLSRAREVYEKLDQMSREALLG